MTTYSMETYSDSTGLTHTTEYRFSDGTRWVKIRESLPGADGKTRNRTRVLYSEFEGDKERRSTLKALEAAKDAADTITVYVEPALLAGNDSPEKAALLAAKAELEEAQNADRKVEGIRADYRLPYLERVGKARAKLKAAEQAVVDAAPAQLATELAEQAAKAPEQAEPEAPEPMAAPSRGNRLPGHSRTEAALANEVARELPQVSVTSWPTRPGKTGYFIVRATDAEGLDVQQEYDEYAMSTRTATRDFIKRVAKAKAKAGQPFAYLKRQTQTAAWVRVDGYTLGELAEARALAERYMDRRLRIIRLAAVEQGGGGSIVFKYLY